MEAISTHQPPAEETRAREPQLRPSLARLLRDDGLVTHEQVDRALAEGTRTGERLGEILLRQKLLDERQLALLLARQWQLSFVDDGEGRIDSTALSVLSREDARRTRAVPVRCEDGLIWVLVVEPTEERLGEIRARASQDVTIGVVTRTSFQRLLAALDQSPGIERETPEALHELADEPPDRSFDDVLALLDDETGHLAALREKVGQLASGVTEREHATRRLESELDAERNARAHDRFTIERLQREAEERDRVLDVARSKVEDLAGLLRPRSTH